MSQAAYDALQAALKKQRGEIYTILAEKLIAQAACVVLNARATNDLNRVTVDRDDVEELDKILIAMGINVTQEEETVNEWIS